MSQVNINFTCPYCGRATTITDLNFWEKEEKIYIETLKMGEVGLYIQAITCPNPECKNLSLKASLHKAEQDWVNLGDWFLKEKISEWQLLPSSMAKSLPDYIPEAIKSDYYEACSICNLSPKASATLARRCLQGMIRDFWGIKKANLYEEIKALEGKIGALEWEAIDSVRKVGNIGAHMEKDINLIIDVEPKEAQLLIKLIEQLIDDWYVDRHEKKIKAEKNQGVSGSESREKERQKEQYK